MENNPEEIMPEPEDIGRLLHRTEEIDADEHYNAWRKFEYIEHLRGIHNEQPENLYNQLDIFQSSVCDHYKNHDRIYTQVLEDRLNGGHKRYKACDGKFHYVYNHQRMDGEYTDIVVGLCPEFERRESLMPYDNSFKEE